MDAPLSFLDAIRALLAKLKILILIFPRSERVMSTTISPLFGLGYIIIFTLYGFPQSYDLLILFLCEGMYILLEHIQFQIKWW